MSNLPHELYDLIIDVLAQDASDRGSLRSCAMVSREFLTRAYWHLFSSIDIIIRGRDNSTVKESITVLEKLHGALQASLAFPTVGFVYMLRNVALYIEGLGRDECYRLIQGGSLGNILQALHGPNHGIEWFSLRVHTTRSINLDFLMLDNGFQRALVGLCQSTNLRKIRIQNLSRLPRSLLHGSRVQHVEMHNNDFSSFSTAKPMILQPESITVSDAEFPSTLNALHWEGGRLGRSARYISVFGRLSTLELLITHVEKVPGALEIAKLASDSLENLYLYIHGLDPAEAPPDPPRSVQPPQPIYLFHQFENLRTLRVTKQVVRPLTEPCIIHPLRRFFDLVTLPSSLNTLIVATMAEHKFAPNVMPAPEEIPNKKEWDLFDAVLMKPIFTTVPHLKIVLRYSVRLMNEHAHQFQEAPFLLHSRQLLLDALPLLRAARSPTNVNVPFKLDVEIVPFQYDPTPKLKSKVTCGPPVLSPYL